MPHTHQHLAEHCLTPFVGPLSLASGFCCCWDCCVKFSRRIQTTHIPFLLERSVPSPRFHFICTGLFQNIAWWCQGSSRECDMKYRMNAFSNAFCFHSSYTSRLNMASPPATGHLCIVSMWVYLCANFMCVDVTVSKKGAEGGWDGLNSVQLTYICIPFVAERL